MYNKLTQAHKRPMSSQEQFGLVLFILKFVFSKFGVFIIFLSLNIGSWGPSAVESHRGQNFSSEKIHEPAVIVSTTNQAILETLPRAQNQLFSKLKIYCIIATIVTLFLNPQQTKYFGGLAVVLKQAGFFSKYGKSEKTVYILSWCCIALFAQMSYQTAQSLALGGYGTPRSPFFF